MLLWTYSRYEPLLDKGFLSKVITTLLNYENHSFGLDNFDILLVIQAATHLERSEDISNDF